MHDRHFSIIYKFYDFTGVMIQIHEINNTSQQTFLVFQGVFSVTLFVFQDVFKTYLQYVFLKCLQDVLQDVFQDVFKTCLQDVL